MGSYGCVHPTDWVHDLLQSYGWHGRTAITIPTIDENIFSIYVLIDKYLSLVTDDYSYRLLETLKKNELEYFDIHKKTILQLVTNEIGYRKSKDYLAGPKENDNNEELVYRIQSLRKYTESVLFLSTRAKPEGKLAQQMIFSAAAGLAMIWVTAIAIYAQYKFGIFTMAFFITPVMSYVFKDRIKEIASAASCCEGTGANCHRQYSMRCRSTAPNRHSGSACCYVLLFSCIEATKPLTCLQWH